MKAKAIFFSPIGGVSIIWILVVKFSNSESISDLFFAYFIINFIAIIVQLFVEFLLLISELWAETTFKFYLYLATVICVSIGFLTFFFISDNYDNYVNLSNSFIAFSSFYFYSICNAFTYNYLYFSKLEKEMDSPVIPTKEGTVNKIEDN
jgi:hypothetical protein